MTARAVLFMWNPQNGKTTTDIFEAPEYDDPFHQAQALMESCKEDFPGSIWSVGTNEEARKIMAATRMRWMGLAEDPMDEFDLSTGGV